LLVDTLSSLTLVNVVVEDTRFGQAVVSSVHPELVEGFIPREPFDKLRVNGEEVNDLRDNVRTNLNAQVYPSGR
jgi:hypothetical protein